jgi:30S ribosomal protein S31
MGRGDKRTKKGKISNGSFGNSRPARVKKAAAPAKAKKAPAKKAAAKTPAKKAAAKKSA